MLFLFPRVSEVRQRFVKNIPLMIKWATLYVARRNVIQHLIQISFLLLFWAIFEIGRKLIPFVTLSFWQRTKTLLQVRSRRSLKRKSLNRISRVVLRSIEVRWSLERLNVMWFLDFVQFFWSSYWFKWNILFLRQNNLNFLSFLRSKTHYVLLFRILFWVLHLLFAMDALF